MKSNRTLEEPINFAVKEKQPNVQQEEVVVEIFGGSKDRTENADRERAVIEMQ